MSSLNRTYDLAERDRYTSTKITGLRRLQGKLLDMAENPKYTEYTQYLAWDEADYLEDVIAFRAVPKPERRKLYANAECPWFGTWRRKDVTAWPGLLSSTSKP